MIHYLTKNVAAAGTRETLTATRTPAAWVIVQAKTSNTGTIWLGDSAVAAQTGLELLSGDSSLLPAQGGTPAPYNLAEIYIDAGVSAEGVRVLYGR